MSRPVDHISDLLNATSAEAVLAQNTLVASVTGYSALIEAYNQTVTPPDPLIEDLPNAPFNTVFPIITNQIAAMIVAAQADAINNETNVNTLGDVYSLLSLMIGGLQS